jgi:hypothetical protein
MACGWVQSCRCEIRSSHAWLNSVKYRSITLLAVWFTSHSMGSTTEDRSPKTLFSLPGEVRMIIWRHVLVFPGVITLVPNKRDAYQQTVLQLLCICRSIKGEAFHLFYWHNTLRFCSPVALYQFLNTLNQRRRQAIQSIVVAGFGLHYTSAQICAKAFSMLSLCPNLTRLQVDLALDNPWTIISQPPHGRPTQEWQNFQEGLDCLESLRGLTRVSIRGLSSFDFMTVQEFNRSEAILKEVEHERASKIKEKWLQSPIRSGR